MKCWRVQNYELIYSKYKSHRHHYTLGNCDDVIAKSISQLCHFTIKSHVSLLRNSNAAPWQIVSPDLPSAHRQNEWITSFILYSVHVPVCALWNFRTTLKQSAIGIRSSRTYTTVALPQRVGCLFLCMSAISYRDLLWLWHYANFNKLISAIFRWQYLSHRFFIRPSPPIHYSPSLVVRVGVIYRSHAMRIAWWTRYI